MKRYLSVVSVALTVLMMAGLFSLPTIAQQRATSLQTSGTIAVTNTFQTAKAADSGRRGCLFQNKGTNSMFVYFGLLANATSALSFEVTTKLYISANNSGIVIPDAINVTGTANDVFVLNCQ